MPIRFDVISRSTAMRAIALLGAVAAIGLSGAGAGAPWAQARDGEAGPAATSITELGYWQERASKECTRATSCAVGFAATPAGKHVVVTNASCQFVIASGLYPANVTLSGLRAGALAPVPGITYLPYSPNGPSTRSFLLNSPAVQIYNPGDVPIITVALNPKASTTTITVGCGIGGIIK